MRRTLIYLLALVLAVGVGALPLHADKSKSGKEQQSASGKVDINTASEAELEALPGIGPAIAGRIVAQRPFKSLQDLERVGLSASDIKKLKGKAKAGRSGTRASADANQGERNGQNSGDQKASTREQRDDSNSSAKASDADRRPEGKVDINSASEQELESLPGVGPATAKKIIAGRPYSSKTELKQAGIPPNTLDKIYPLVVAHRANASTNENESTSPTRPTEPTTRNETSGRGTPQSDRDTEEEPPRTTTAQTPPEKGMVWVNTDSGILHREGDQWYGKTKSGKFMTEDEALKAGYRESKHK